MAACNANVGKYYMEVDYLKLDKNAADDDQKHNKRHQKRPNADGTWALTSIGQVLDETIILLFNPWCQGE